MPVSISSRAELYVTQLPTSTGTFTISRNSENTRGSALLETWRAEVTVDCTTIMSAPASTATGARRLALAGVTETAHLAPLDLTSSMRAPIRSSLTGAAYSRWRTSVTSLAGASTICASTLSGSSYFVWTPSKFITPSPPSRSNSTANEGETIASIAEAIIGVDIVRPSIENSVLTWSGLIVTSPGTMATSSKP